MEKKILLTSAGLALALSSFAQLPVSTAPQNRKVVLEEFTGIHCQYCPDGHKRANELKASKPAGDVILVNIHTGGYATPGTGEPDYRTAEGNAIVALPVMNLDGYPAGSINRHQWSGIVSTANSQAQAAMSRAYWAKYADSVLAKPSYVNVALQGTLDVQTRVLTVNVQAYYTGTTTVANNLTVMLTEDNVYGPQIDSGPFYPAMRNADGTYTHNHMLRKVLTASALGEVLSPTVTATSIAKTYTYTVPAQFVNNATTLGNLHLVAFIAEGNNEIMTAADGPITLTNFAYTTDMGMASVTSESEVCKGVLNPVVKITNNGSANITSATITYNVNGGTNSTYSYSGTLRPTLSESVALPLINFTPSATNTLNVTVTNVNGSADQNAANNVTTKAAINLTTRVANDENMTMNFTQDRYGSESSWKVSDEATGTVIASEGPYDDLAANGVLLHRTTFTVSPSKCYKLEVMDAFGDGINSGYGAGKYELKSSAAVLVTSNGQYGAGENKWYKSNGTLTSLAIGNQNITLDGISLFPNPAYESTNLKFTLAEATKVQVIVFDATGRLVANVADKQMQKGAQNVTINTSALSSGIYNVKIQTEKGSTTQRFSVIK